MSIDWGKHRGKAYLNSVVISLNSNNDEIILHVIIWHRTFETDNFISYSEIPIKNIILPFFSLQEKIIMFQLKFLRMQDIEIIELDAKKTHWIKFPVHLLLLFHSYIATFYFRCCVRTIKGHAQKRNLKLIFYRIDFDYLQS